MIQTVYLSLTPGGIRPIVHVSQYDTDRDISLQLDDSASGTCTIQGTRPDGAGVEQAATFQGSTQVLSWTPNADFTDVCGDVLCEAVFVNNRDRIGSANFILRVEPAGKQDDAPGPYDTLTITEPGTYNCAPYAEVTVDVPEPAGTLNVTENGVVDVSGYEKVQVSVPQPAGTMVVHEPGTYNVHDYKNVNVSIDLPEGSKRITANGTHDVYDYAEAEVAVPEPSGTKRITQNGTHDVKDFASAEVAITLPSGTRTITNNGTYNVYYYEEAEVNVPQPAGTVDITENGAHNISRYANAEVNVPVGVFPSGTRQITANDTNINVRNYEYVDVAVPEPAGTKAITANGTNINVKDYKYVDVAVPLPSGAKEITENGTFNVYDYASAVVNVPETPEEDVIANFLDVRGSYPAVLDLSGTRIAWATMYGLYARPYEEVILNADRISNYFFAECEEMTKATLINPSSIASHCFEHCASLQELHIQCTAVPTLDSQAFDLTPIYSGTGKIYFPTQALADTAKQATNWSLFASKIYAEP